MTQEQAKQLQQCTEQIVQTRIALKDADLTAKAAQRQYDNALAAIVQAATEGGSAASTGSAPSTLSEVAKSVPGPVPTWLSSKSGS
jgi:hypothetical protein